MVRIKGYAASAFAIIAWGLTFASTRSLLSGFSALEIMVLRFIMAWAVLRLMEVLRRPDQTADEASRKSAGRRLGKLCDELLFAGMGITGIVAYQFLENCALYYTNATNVAILTSFAPIATAILARVFTNDRSLSLPLVIGSLIAVLGASLVALDGASNLQMRPLGDFMALSAMFSWGAYSVLIDKVNARGYDQITVMRKAFFWSLVIIAPIAIWGTSDAAYHALDGSFRVTLAGKVNAERFSIPLNWMNILFLGVFASAACFVLWNYACKYLGVVYATICLYLIPIIGVIFAAMFLGESPTAMSVTGGLIITIGVVIATAKHKRIVKNAPNTYK